MRDKDYRDVAEDDGSDRGGNSDQPGTRTVHTELGRGTYHVIVEDDFTGGDWRLLVTYLGPSGGS